MRFFWPDSWLTNGDYCATVYLADQTKEREHSIVLLVLVPDRNPLSSIRQLWHCIPNSLSTSDIHQRVHLVASLIAEGSTRHKPVPCHIFLVLSSVLKVNCGPFRVNIRIKRLESLSSLLSRPAPPLFPSSGGPLIVCLAFLVFNGKCHQSVTNHS